MDRDFTANLVHLLRNPLNSMSLQLQVARRRLQGIDGEQAAVVLAAIDAAQHELQRTCRVLNLLVPDQRTTAGALPAVDADE